MEQIFEWAWQRMGDYHYLVKQHGMREIVIHAIDKNSDFECCDHKNSWPIPAMNNNGILKPIDPEQAEAKMITTAVNNTYGKGINPEAVPELVEALEKAIEWDGYDDTGVSALWLEDAQKALQKAQIEQPEPQKDPA